jgi:hypothetical protein
MYYNIYYKNADGAYVTVLNEADSEDQARANFSAKSPGLEIILVWERPDFVPVLSDGAAPATPNVSELLANLRGDDDFGIGCDEFCRKPGNLVEQAADLIEGQAAEIKRLRQWVNDLQSGMYVNCVYCGHRYGPAKETPVSMASVLKAHIEQCPEHPMSKLKTENDQLQKRLCSPYGDGRTVDKEHFAIVEVGCTEIYAYSEYVPTPELRPLPAPPEVPHGQT